MISDREMKKEVVEGKKEREEATTGFTDRR